MTKDKDDISMWDIDLKCRDCGWTGISKNTEFATNSNNKVLMICPRCKAVNNFEVMNEKEGS